MNDVGYRGRFAPSPTGPLHFGSLIAALGSFLEARSHGGHWLLRMDDLDRPRCSREAADQILRVLEAYGFEWDGEVVWQGTRDMAYRAALDRLQANGMVYPCACTRRELADSVLAPDGAAIYPGTCRDGLRPGREGRAWRLRVNTAQVGFDDAIQGRIEADLAREAGDFVLLRADGLFAYQLAVVVDDAEAGVSHVIRGADLLASTARQVYVQNCLGLKTPAYGHLPAAVDAAGRKLSKQTRAVPLDSARAAPTLIAALRFLGQPVPRELDGAPLAAVWHWARAHWSLDAVPRRRTVTYNPLVAEPRERNDARG